MYLEQKYWQDSSNSYKYSQSTVWCGCNWLGQGCEKTKVVLIPDSNRVWGSAPVENEIEIPVSSGMQRSIDFSGEWC